jgi:single-strand DNA-binding protein
MANVNSVVVSGNLTRDPENFGKATPVVKLGIATNRSFKPKDADEYTEEVSFFDITVFGNFGGLVMRKLKKGDSITVSGRIKQETWQTDDGDNRSKVVIIAEQIDSEGFFRSKDEDNPVESQAPSASPAAPAQPSADDDIPF